MLSFASSSSDSAQKAFRSCRSCVILPARYDRRLTIHRLTVRRQFLGPPSAALGRRKVLISLRLLLSHPLLTRYRRSDKEHGALYNNLNLHLHSHWQPQEKGTIHWLNAFSNSISRSTSGGGPIIVTMVVAAWSIDSRHSRPPSAPMCPFRFIPLV